MTEVRELYQELILDHCKHPATTAACPTPTAAPPDTIPCAATSWFLTLSIEDDVVKEARFEGEGCAISTASASLMSELIVGKTTDEVNALFTRFHKMVTSKDGADDFSGLDKLAVFSGVRDYPLRVKCATLAWHSLKAALARDSDTVTTE